MPSWKSILCRQRTFMDIRVGRRQENCHFILHFAETAKKSGTFRMVKCRFSHGKVPLFARQSAAFLSEPTQQPANQRLVIS